LQRRVIGAASVPVCKPCDRAHTGLATARVGFTSEIKRVQ
jgi:hypothetical protein